MSSELEQFLTPYLPEVRALTWKLRALIREVMPDAIEQLDAPAHLVGYGLDRLLIEPGGTPNTGDPATAAPRQTI